MRWLGSVREACSRVFPGNGDAMKTRKMSTDWASAVRQMVSNEEQRFVLITAETKKTQPTKARRSEAVDDRVLRPLEHPTRARPARPHGKFRTVFASALLALLALSLAGCFKNEQPAATPGAAALTGPPTAPKGFQALAASPTEIILEWGEADHWRHSSLPRAQRRT